MPKKKKTRYSRPEHSTDSFKPHREYRTVICSWIKGTVELHILKFPPEKEPTTFYIVGRLGPEQEYSSFLKKATTEFISTYAKYVELTKKLDSKYYADGSVKK